jgi:hypothetical protein
MRRATVGGRQRGACRGCSQGGRRWQTAAASPNRTTRHWPPLQVRLQLVPRKQSAAPRRRLAKPLVNVVVVGDKG